MSQIIAKTSELYKVLVWQEQQQQPENLTIIVLLVNEFIDFVPSC